MKNKTETLRDPSRQTRSGRLIKYTSDYVEKCTQKRERQSMIYQVKKALNKCTNERTKDDNDLLVNCQDLVKHVDIAKQNRLIAQAHQEIILDDQELLEMKCKELVKSIIAAKSCVFYTGAGISTSAKIPDYRGPNGLWTLQEKGLKIELPDFTKVTPTYSHMALNSLVKHNIVSHVVSQNCDGLHLRSGINRDLLSELHGNCFIEFCIECSEEYVRLFDVTERSSFRKHVTGRYCSNCKKSTKSEKKSDVFQLRDSIIHFGEKLKDGYPYNWKEALDTVKSTNLIICFGTSLKVLKQYSCLWPKKTDLAIVSIQWTPKDKQAKPKINGYCDDVMRLLIRNLQDHYHDLKVDEYSLKTDPIFKIAINLKNNEIDTTSKPFLLNHMEHMLSKNIDISKEDEKHTQNDSHLSKDLNKEKIKTENVNSWYNKSFKNRKKTIVNKKKK